MAARVCSIDPVFVLTTSEPGTEAALRAAVARCQASDATVTLLVAHTVSGSPTDAAKRWLTLASAHRARHGIPFPIVLLEYEGPSVNDIVARATPSNAVILVGGDVTPWWLPWCSYSEWLAGWLSRTGRTVEFVPVGSRKRAPAIEYVGGPRVLAGRAIGHPAD